MSINNEALTAEQKYRTSIEEAQDYIENFDILETINNVGNDEVFTPVKICKQMLDILPDEVWSNPDYKWLNPSDKNGVFPREIAIRLNEGLKDWEPDEEKRKKHILQNMLYSIGLTKFTSQVSRRTLYYCSDANRKFDGKIDEHGKSINGYAIGNGSWFNSPEGNILTPKSKHNFNKQGKCIFCGTNAKDKKGNPGRYSDPNQIEHYAYDFIHNKELDKYTQKIFFGGKNMKFDIIIGNPPYQLSDGGQGSSARPIYHKFVEQAIKMKPKYISMIMPARWYTGGKGLDSFRRFFLADKRLTKIYDYENGTDVFPNVKIEGGVMYFLWERDKKDDCEIHNVNKNNSTSMKRPLTLDGTDVFIRSNRAISIFIKTSNGIEKNNFASLVSSRKPFGIATDFDKIVDKNKKDFVKIYGFKKEGFTDIKNVSQNHDFINKWKVYISYAYGMGQSDKTQVINTPFVGNPNTICTETFLVIGPFNSKTESENVISYMKTKFFRFHVKLLKNTQHGTAKVYAYVPLEDFSKPWDDEKLYRKYGLNKEEISYIESTIEEMS